MSHVTPEALWSLTALWIVLVCMILVLNLPVLYIFWSSEQLRSPRNMYIASLIVSDILIGATIPVKIYLLHFMEEGRPFLGDLCQGVLVTQTFVLFVNMASVLGLTLVRHRNITMSRTYRQSRGEAGYLIAFIWIASLAASVRVPYVVENKMEGKTWKTCVPQASFRPNLVGFPLLVDYCLPLAVIYFLCFHARRHMYHVRCAKDPIEGAAVKKRDCRVVRMVMILADCFVVLHLPLHLLHIVAYVKKGDMWLWYEICQLLMFSTAVTNIIVYVTFNRRAASVFLAFMKLHRGSQVGVAMADPATMYSGEPSCPTTRSSNVLRNRMSQAALSLFRSSQAALPHDHYSVQEGACSNAGAEGGRATTTTTTSASHVTPTICGPEEPASDSFLPDRKLSAEV
ncbi:QRFP-like peptide receptor [Littorina saxatilis]|uniref:QRFP-like peptide receptor n=1 Tax=Littorina saxatilis TaxID=31220 RepID=UPI0038B53884